MTEYFNNANDEAKKRMDDFEDAFIPRLATIENALEIFKDPAFTLVYRKAQLQAACSGKTSDYDILTELLIHRFKKQKNKNSCIGINGAIEIVEQISDEALLALTVATSINYGVTPVANTMCEGLDILNNLYNSLLNNCELPNESDWLDQLDILKAIRISRFGRFNRLEDFYCKLMEGYYLPGIKVDSDSYKTALSIINTIKLNGVLVNNELMEGYVRLPIIDKKSIDTLSKNTELGPFRLTEPEKTALHKVFELYDNDEKLVAKSKNLFMERFDSYIPLKKIHDWWNSIPNSFDITIIGRVLGHANAQRCFPGYPPLE